MKKETKRRIKYYQDLLPGLKERVAAAGVMLFIAMIVTVTATYAWVTLSRAPEITGVNTTVTSNGNLEIALSPDDGNQPAEFDVDESAPKSTDVTVSNLQWGNLINLSDPAYGIDNLTLRPAQLNTASLKFSPLWGAVYGSDGRITMLDSDYTFAKYKAADDEFVASKDYGVRAIASYELETSQEDTRLFDEKAQKVNDVHTEVNNAYGDVVAAIPSLSSILSTYIQGEVPESMGGGAQDPFTAAQLRNAYNVYVQLLETMEAHKKALVELANFQRYVNSVNNATSYVELTWDEIVAGKANYNAASASSPSKDGVVSLVGLTQFIADMNTVETDKGYVEQYCTEIETGTRKVYWATGGVSGYQIQDMVSRLIDYSSMSVDINGVETTFSQITGNVTGYAMDLVGMNGEHTNAYVYNGIIKRLEQSAIDEAHRMQGQQNDAVVTVKVTAKVGVSMTITLYGDCYTKAAGSSAFMENYAAAVGNPLEGKTAIAKDTYGMAVDFWIRTNAESTYLTLEGALVSDENSGEVLSYDGVNRVWGSTDTTVLTRNSTTQGNGSCYIYYADTPEDMMRSLNLLQSMKVAFVDADGNMMAGARMDTDNYYAVNGRITVPLIVEENTGVTYTYTDDLNVEQTARALTHMVSDSAKRVTAIIYLDGTRLSNAEVLAAAEIQGQLNLQFGSSEDLETIGDNKLLVAERTVTAVVDKTEMEFLGTSDAERTVNIVVRVDGDAPETVTGFFTRAINATQGQRESTMTFRKADGGDWMASYVFDAPGTYYLRYVRLDGVDYILEDPPKVEVKGFAVKSISWAENSNEASVYTPESSYTEQVRVEFASNVASEMPGTVSARFLRDDGVMVNADLKYNSSARAWIGTGTFYNSGTYTLQYLLLDGNYFDIGDDIKILDLSLGMKVQVYNNGNTLEDKYNKDAASGTYAKNVGVKIFDNEDNEINGLEGARLRYSLGGSATNTVDTNLTWDDQEGWYKGTLPITRPGRYSYLEVVLGSNKLTRVVDAPAFVIISPDPPVYDTSSKSVYHDKVQFAPLTNDAYIGPITINDIGAAFVSMEVQNSVTGETYTVVQGNASGETLNGYISQEGENCYIHLPAYALDEDAEKPVYTQEGTWTVKSISLWECYDENSNYHDENNPIIWTDADTDTDFSQLSTTVSCSMNVEMRPGTTELGSANAAFMANNYVKDTGMSVAIVDDAGRAIPKEKISDVALGVNYLAPADNTEYGYRVFNGASRNYTINFAQADDGSWKVDDAENKYNWQYVGPYQVTGLSITMKDSKDPDLTYTAGQNGVPAQYVVRSEAPTVDNLVVTKTKQDTVFGKTGDSVTGTFLQSYGGSSLGEVEIALTPKDADGTSYAILEGMTASLNLEYLDGQEAPYGGYAWSTGNALADITVPLTKNSDSNKYVAGTTSLLAGRYKVSAEVKVGDVTRTITGWDNISVYSMKPDVTMTAVSPSGTVTVNADAGIYVSDNTFQGNNVIVDNGKGAVVFAGYEPCTAGNNVGAWGDYTGTAYSTNYANYTMPEITFSLSNVGAVCTDFNMVIPNNNGVNVSFTGNGAIEPVEIGWITTGTDASLGKEDTGSWWYGSQAFSYKTETPHIIGTQNITALTATHNSVDYTVTLNTPIYIRQENAAVPSIIFAEGKYTTETNTTLKFSALDGVISEDGRSFKITMPTSAEYEKKTAEVYGDLEVNISDKTDSDGWSKVSDVISTQYIYKINEGYVSGYPKEISHTQSGGVFGIGAKDTYVYESQYYLEYEVYKRHSITYQRTGLIKTYDAIYGLIGWNVNGTQYLFADYPNGLEIEVTSANTIAEPIIDMLSKKEKSFAEKMQTSITVFDEQQNSNLIVNGAVKSGTATDRSASTARNNAINNANVAAKAACSEPTGYTIITSKDDLKLTETSIVSGMQNWVDIKTTN